MEHGPRQLGWIVQKTSTTTTTTVAIITGHVGGEWIRGVGKAKHLLLQVFLFLLLRGTFAFIRTSFQWPDGL